MRFVCYVPTTGNIVLSGDCRDGDVQHQAWSGVSVLATPGVVATSDTHFVAQGAPVAYSSEQRANKAAMPAYLAAWDNAAMAWVDLRALADIKAERGAQIRAAAAAANEENITVQNVTFKADAETRAELMQEALVAQMAIADGLSYSLDWERANGNGITLTAAQVKTLVRAINNRTAQIRVAARAKRQAIEAATSKAEVEAVTWP